MLGASKDADNGIPTRTERSTPSKRAAAGFASTMPSLTESTIKTGCLDAANMESVANRGGAGASAAAPMATVPVDVDCFATKTA